MDENYRKLGLTPDADEETIKTTYKKLAEQYNPDNFSEPAQKKHAVESMDEINRAFDEIMNYLRAGTVSTSGNDRDDFYLYIRRLIQNGEYETAIEQLNTYNNENEAQWQFLMGSALYYGGYISRSFEYFKNAAQMEPETDEYTAAFKRMNNSRSGNIYSSPYSADQTYSFEGVCCDPCTVCQCLVCINACCRH